MAYTNVTRITGMYSGLDTQKLITDLMKAETLKLNKTKRTATTVSWKQEMYRNVYSDLKSFQRSFLDVALPGSLRLQGTFKGQTISVKTGTGQDSSAVIVGSGAKDGKYSVRIDQLAVADLYESASKIGGDIHSEKGFEFDVACIKDGSSYEITLDGAKRKITFNEGDGVSGGTLTFKDGAIGIKDKSGNVTLLDEQQFIGVFNQKLENAFGVEGTDGKQKIEAKLTESGGISIFTNGHHSEFSIADGSYVFSSATAQKKSALAVGAAEAPRELGFSVKIGNNYTNINVSVTAGMTQKELVSNLNEALKNKGLDSKMSFSLDTKTGNIKFTGNSISEKIEISSQAGVPDSMEYLGFEVSTVKLSPASPLTGLGITSGSAAKFSTDLTLSEAFGDRLTKESFFTINGRSFSYTGDTKLSDVIDQVNNADLGVTLRYDEINEVFQLESSSTGYANRIEMSGKLLTDNLGFGVTAKRAAVDSVATINGITLTRPTNEYEFLDVNWKLNKTTGDDELTVTVSRDTDSIVDKLKGFVDGYNAMIENLNKITSTSRPRNNGAYYEPLLDEEKAEMTEKEISIWEEYAKEGLLYRDSIVSGITQQLRTALNQSVELSDGSKISLYSLGITTGDWRNGGQLVIDEEKLRKAIEVYGDDVITLFTKSSEEGGKGLAERVNDIINKTVDRNGSIARKAGIEGSESEYNNELYRQLKAHDDNISNMLKRLAEKETYYYNMFARMEAAMSKADSQMQYIQSVMGG